MLGVTLRGERFDRRRGLLLGLVLLGFITGGSIGALLFSALEFTALAVPAAGSAAGGDLSQLSAASWATLCHITTTRMRY